jgi:hypothetical protein
MINVVTLAAISRAVNTADATADLHIQVTNRVGTFRVHDVQHGGGYVVVVEGADEQLSELVVPASQAYVPQFTVVD